MDASKFTTRSVEVINAAQTARHHRGQRPGRAGAPARRAAAPGAGHHAAPCWTRPAPTPAPARAAADAGALDALPEGVRRDRADRRGLGGARPACWPRRSSSPPA